jgi:GntR family transcriptional regulator/MocR family aminotransferase
MNWTFEDFAVTGDPRLPMATRIARAISDDIRRGRLTPSSRLPGSRKLAEHLGVHRNTAIAAYRALEAEGWTLTRPGSGTYIAPTLPELQPTPFAAAPPGPAQSPAYHLPTPPHLNTRRAPPPGTLMLAGGIPDLRLAPSPQLGRAWRRAVRRVECLGYGDPQGEASLRTALSDMLRATRGVPADPQRMLITRGAQMALHLIGRALLEPGDHVAVEAYGYPPGWSALRAAGATLVPVPVDQHGLDVEALQARHAQHPLRAIYVTPHHQYPTLALLSSSRRLRLLRFAAAEGIAVIEDDYDHEFHFDGRPVLPLASADPHGVVLYVGTLSKVLAPGLRIGYVVAPPPVIQALTAWRTLIDRQNDRVTESAVAELLEDGELARHIRRMRRVYRARRAAVIDALQQHLGDALQFTVPPGGMALWARAAPGIDVQTWQAQAATHGVRIDTAQQFTFDGEPRPYLRLGFACLTPDELHEAVRRLAAARPKSPQRPQAGQQAGPLY